MIEDRDLLRFPKIAIGFDFGPPLRFLADARLGCLCPTIAVFGLCQQHRKNPKDARSRVCGRCRKKGSYEELKILSWEK
eukprot:jgi/Psemu1/305172/fgenesh1_kg.184_\